MKHKLISAVIIALIAVCLLCGTAAAAITGSGTSSNPYIIHDKNDLRLLSGDGYAAYTTAGYFALDADITFTDSDAAFTPIGNNAHKFIGHFDGRNHKITKLKITGDPAGLFADVSSGASISNIEFHDAQITGTGGSGTGVLYGRCYQAGTKVSVSNVKVYDSKITSSGADVGGVAGFGAAVSSQVTAQSCDVENCYIYAGTNQADGIFGYGTYSTGTTCTITNCNVLKSTIRADTFYAGGIYGSYRNNGGQPTVSGCTVTDCTVLTAANGGGVTGGYSS